MASTSYTSFTSYTLNTINAYIREAASPSVIKHAIRNYINNSTAVIDIFPDSQIMVRNILNITEFAKVMKIINICKETVFDQYIKTHINNTPKILEVIKNYPSLISYSTYITLLSNYHNNPDNVRTIVNMMGYSHITKEVFTNYILNTQDIDIVSRALKEKKYDIHSLLLQEFSLNPSRNTSFLTDLIKLYKKYICYDHFKAAIKNKSINDNVIVYLLENFEVSYKMQIDLVKYRSGIIIYFEK